MKRVLLICSKSIEVAEGVNKEVFFAYRQQPTPTGYEDIKTVLPDGKAVALSIKVGMNDNLVKTIKDSVGFPCYITVDDEAVNAEGYSLCKVKVDRDSKGKVRKDRNGNSHLICIVRGWDEIIAAPSKTYSLDDLDTFTA